MTSGKLSEPSENEKALEERVHYLAGALEKVCKEREVLRTELTCITEKFDACRKAFEMLLDELNEEGATLKAKDRDKLRKSLSDLKDYEIYKDVIHSSTELK